MMRASDVAAAKVELETGGYDTAGVPAAWLTRANQELSRGDLLAAQRYLEAGRAAEDRAHLDNSWHGFPDTGFDL